MATKSTRRDNRNTPEEQWLPVGYEMNEAPE